jgi:predicted RNase H-like HicB family nuclease|nr:MAG TPA: HicB-like antitoxin [Caudoviricetes sp.]
MMKIIYPACFYPCEEKADAYTVVVPDLPGCVSEGDTLLDAITMATEAASGWVLDELEYGKEIPPASSIQEIKPESPDGLVSLITLDIEAYAKK